MIDAWEGKPVAWEGDDEQTRTPVRLAPLPVQKPYQPLWVAAFGPKALAQAGRLGLPYLASPIEPEDQLLENHARHREAIGMPYLLVRSQIPASNARRPLAGSCVCGAPSRARPASATSSTT